MNTILGNAFPEDKIMGEEDSGDLRDGKHAALKDRVVELANQALTAELSPGESEKWGIGPGKELTADALLDTIDRGNYEGGRTGSEHRPVCYSP